MKKRLAIWIHGGIGNGDFSQGYPMLEKVINRLAEQFDIVVYSHVPPNPGFVSKFFASRYPPRYVKSSWLRWIFLHFIFYSDYLKKGFSIIQAFWGYPNGLFVVLIGKILRIPSVINVLGADCASIKSIDYGIFHKKIPRAIASWSYTNATSLITISEYQKVKLEEFGIKRNILVIPWGADSEMYTFLEKSTRSGPLKIIHVAHHNAVKDQKTLLRAFQLIVKKTPAQLQIFGLDCMNGELEKFYRELKIENQVEFRGVVPYNEMPKHYHDADIMLHTSLSEGQCMALTEAAACGVLVAGTKVGLLYDLADNCAIKIEIGDYQNLAAQVLMLSTNTVEWKSRVQNAYHWSRVHDFEWTIQNLSNVLKQLTR